MEIFVHRNPTGCETFDLEDIKELEANSRFPTGIGRLERGECPAGGLNPMACMFCEYGHMLECHFPHTCEEAQCSHYEEEALNG